MNTKNALKKHCLAGIGLLLGACAGLQPTQAPSLEQQIAEQGYEIEREVDSISNFRLSGWSYVDPRGILLRDGPRKEYLVTLRQRCNDLRGAETLATTSTAYRLTTFDSILFKRSTGKVQRCPVDRIYVLKPAGSL